VWWVVGLIPSVVHESPSLHRSFHEQAEDSLRADRPVTIHFENLDLDARHNITLLGHQGERLYSGRLVPGRTRVDYRLVAPPPGSYRIVSASHPDVVSELRFTRDGDDELHVRVPDEEDRFVKVDPRGWDAFAGQLADSSHRADHGARVTLEGAFSAFNLGLGMLLIFRRPRDRTARLLAVGMIGTAATFNHQSHIVLKDYLLGDWWSQHIVFHLASGLAYTFAVVVFPDGRLVPFAATRLSRGLLRAGYVVAAFVVAQFVFDWSDVAHPGQTFFTVLFGVGVPVVGCAAQTYRLRRTQDPELRQQSRLLRGALLPMLAVALVYLGLIATVSKSSDSWVQEAGLAVFPALFVLIPLALVMGILRYRLWDIDVLISRTLLSVGLVAFIGAVYVVVVVVIGHAAGPGDSAAFKIAATAIAALAFEPVRERLQRLANRLVYGERATPYEVMADFSDRLAGVVSVDQVLPRTAEAVARGVGAMASRVSAYLPGGGERTVHWPAGASPSSFSRFLTVSYGEEPVGEIAVAKPPGERLSAGEDALLTSLASQAGVAFNNARLTLELQARLQEISEQAADLHASRQRIVTAREVQRQRVVQLIQQRVETRLEAADLRLAEIERVLSDDPDEALECVDDLIEQCGHSLDALRDLARGIFPAVLAERGVMPALDAYLLQAALPLRVELDGDSDRVEPRAEATVYFCVVQALANAGTYAPGSDVRVRVTVADGQLEFSVVDDGPGVDPARLAQGADVQDMRDRVEAIGGRFDARSAPGAGTSVEGWVPFPTEL
jgi:signal transduction histidine kinase